MSGDGGQCKSAAVGGDKLSSYAPDKPRAWFEARLRSGHPRSGRGQALTMKKAVVHCVAQPK